jgi:hypothetical protein
MSCRVISQWIFSNHMFTYLCNDTYKNLVVKSVGLNLFSLLSSSSSSSVDASSFGCCYFVSVLDAEFCNFFSNCWSVCNTLSDIYHGAFTIAQRTLFWYLCNISMFELLPVPQRGIHVQVWEYSTKFLTVPRITSLGQKFSSSRWYQFVFPHMLGVIIQTLYHKNSWSS